MKKFLSLIVLLVALTSCEEDVRFNDPAVQALKNNEIWRATSFKAVRRMDNSLTITASNGFETVTLKTESADPNICEGTPIGGGTDKAGCEYYFGYDTVNVASYVLSADGIIMSYETGVDAPDELEEGALRIYNRLKYTDLTQGYISGEFYFNAENTAGEAVNFSQGIFYKIPVELQP